MSKDNHIIITDKNRCSGCAACMSACPKKCISMQEDEEGFLYPHVDENTCISCSKCVTVCPYTKSEFTNKLEKEELAICYAAYNKNEEIRYQSSSGGMFRAFSDYIIAEGGVVFGAKFDKDFTVEHAYTETMEGLVDFMGSKYMQSRMGNSFTTVKSFLDKGRKVLFTGCGCQIAGLKRYLKKDYANLFCIDLICHGVDSPRIWLDYLHYLMPNETIKQINFRDKITGQDNSSICIKSCNSWFCEKKKNNIYFRNWRYGLFVRPSCEICPFKADNRVSDITIADCWGFQKMAPEMYDDNDLSSVIVHTAKGMAIFEAVQSQITYKKSSLDDVKAYNADYIRSSPFNYKKRAAFWRDYHKQTMPFGKLLKKHLEYSHRQRIAKFIKKITHKCWAFLRR